MPVAKNGANISRGYGLWVAVVLLVVLAACGGGGNEEPTESFVRAREAYESALPTEASLRARAEAYESVFTNEDGAGVYQFETPRFRKVCPSSPYVSELRRIWEELRALADGPFELGVFSVSVAHVTGSMQATGSVRATGSVHFEIRLGEVVGDTESLGKVPQAWVFVDKEWYLGTDDIPLNCPGL